MTEEEVLERFDKYGNAIITLKKKLEEKTQENINLESVKSALDIAISNLKKEQETFKEKTYQTIKYLVENVIEPMEKEINTPKRGNVQALEELARLKEDNQMLNDTLTTLGSEKEYLAQSCEHFNEENLSLKEQIEDKDTIIAGLKNEIGVKTSEIEKLNADIAKLKEEMAPKIIKRNGAEVFPYKFASLQKETMSKVLDFVDCLFENVNEKDGTMILSDVYKAAQKANLSDKELEVFTRRFSEMKVNGQPVIGFDNGIAHTVFKSDWIKQYISTLTR